MARVQSIISITVESEVKLRDLQMELHEDDCVKSQLSGI